MQTFMPYTKYHKVAKTLDYRRLGKQRVEAMQTYNQITTGKGGYPHHPINKMWKGYESSLAEYTNAMITEWISRGYKNTMEFIKCCDYLNIEDDNHPTKLWHYIPTYLTYNRTDFPYEHLKPPWIYDRKVRISHQSNLLRKDWDYYSKQFGTHIGTNMPYIWVKEG